MLEDDVDHVTVSVRFFVLRSEYVPVAVNCFVAPWVIEVTAGATVIDKRIAGPSASAESDWLAPNSPTTSASGSARAVTRRTRPPNISPTPRPLASK